ncbi:MAG: aldo/keto reductase [Saprospiraceae bacterium]|nr:aldo/keto reductase [Saprospiraceae bacterium]
MLNRESESLIKDLSQYPVGIVARECLANGFLSGSINRETVFANGTLNSRYTIDEIAERIDQVAKFEFLIDGDIRNMAQAALRAVIDQTGVNTVLSGAKNKKEIDDALTAANANPFSSQDLMTARALLTKNFKQLKA